MQKQGVSAFIICLNEEAYLGNCIESLEGCAEIVIVDSGSTDGTQALVQSYIDDQKLPGAISLVARRGSVVHFF